jgi:hypothetical protein
MRCDDAEMQCTNLFDIEQNQESLADEFFAVVAKYSKDDVDCKEHYTEGEGNFHAHVERHWNQSREPSDRCGDDGEWK